MTASDREANEALIHQLISEIQLHLSHLLNGIDQTQPLWQGPQPASSPNVCPPILPRSAPRFGMFAPPSTAHHGSNPFGPVISDLEKPPFGKLIEDWVEPDADGLRLIASWMTTNGRNCSLRGWIRTTRG